MKATADERRQAVQIARRLLDPNEPRRKRTWLFYSGEVAPSDLRWSAKPGTHQVGWFDRNKPTLSKSEAIKSPPSFAETLISLARHSRALFELAGAG